MLTLNIKPGHKSVKAYYEAISSLSELGVSHEGAVSPAFASLLRHCANQFNQTLIEKYPLKTSNHDHILFIDGALVDSFNLVHGFWEAKDTSDDLDKEIKKKFDSGYPKNNILFQAPNRIVIWQDGGKVFDEDISKPENLIEGLKVLFEYEAPAFEQWQKAVEEFKLKVQELATGLLQLIEKERQTNSLFIQAFNDLIQLCQETINPNISIQAVEEMLIQHLLTERIFRKVFNNPDFVERNVIAHEIEKVIEDRGMRAWTEVGFSSIYYLLAKLERSGLIDGRHERQAGRGPMRKVYHITARGKARWLAAAMEALSAPVHCNMRLPLGLVNLPRIPAADAIAALQEYHGQLRQHRYNLRRPQSFFKKNHAQHDIYQRIDIIAQAGLYEAIGVDRPDIQQPIPAHDEGRKCENEQGGVVFQSILEFLPAPHDNNQRHQKEKRPDHAVQYDLQGRNRVQRLPVNRTDPPDQKCRSRIHHSPYRI